VTGALAAGSTLTIRIDGTMPGGWEALHLLEATITSGNRELDRLRFDIEDNKLTVGDQEPDRRHRRDARPASTFG
jgi:hypothetical protein